jgi:Domain of unknown function (DUF4342)
MFRKEHSMSMPSRVEEFQVTGAQLVSSVKNLVHQGNIRRISIRNAAGVTLLEIPLVVGLAGAVFVPVWAALGALAALVAKCTLAVERVESAEPRPSASAPRSTKSKPRTKKRPSDTA